MTRGRDGRLPTKTRRIPWRIARQIRIDRRVAEDEVVRVTLHGQDGAVRFRGDVR